MKPPKKQPYPAQKKRSKSIKVTLTPLEYVQVCAAAEKAGQRPAIYCRTASLSGASRGSVPAINREKWGELGKLGGLLNQVARQLNQGEKAPSVAELVKLIEKTRAELIALRAQLVGEEISEEIRRLIKKQEAD